MNMDNSWENLEPSPIEFLHGLLLEKFHEFRRKKTVNLDVEINGIEPISFVKEKRTNHERQPSRFGKRK